MAVLFACCVPHGLHLQQETSRQMAQKKIVRRRNLREKDINRREECHCNCFFCQGREPEATLGSRHCGEPLNSEEVHSFRARICRDSGIILATVDQCGNW
ncbi:hypothetical protein BCR34DRAFT_560605 [Clohesyomyces aquaticus]|uniref:Uncharacterized protein n=1 Tax=Clohesyomyces aquaticus TaxID=1231657 RepID=A0A1Y1ZVQ1_9PLEO|nr:hypothetical protein BCR34DRAFT_560605 [Clohesyomyces aquaticus]